MHIVNATFVSVWDKGKEVTTSCKVNTETKEVFDIEVITDTSLSNCEDEYILIDGCKHPVFYKDSRPSKKCFWYDAEGGRV